MYGCEDEIHAIESIVMAVSAGRVMMQHAEARDRDDCAGRNRCDDPC